MTVAPGEFNLDGNAPIAKARRKDKRVAETMAMWRGPDTGYVQQDFREAPPGVMGFDLETHDPTLLEKGSAWAFDGVGEILGVAVAWEGFKAYYPISHREGNVSKETTYNWLRHHLKRDDLKFVCANAVYDLGWARREIGLYPVAGAIDVQFMAALLDENRRSYKLDELAWTYLSERKKTDLIKMVMDHYRFSYSEVMSNLKQLHAASVGPYAATDADLTYRLYHAMLPEIVAQGLTTVHELESALILMSTEMKRRGIRVNVRRAEELAEEISKTRIPGLVAQIKRHTLVEVAPWESESLERALNACGIVPGRTRTGEPQIDKDSLALWAKTEPVAAMILDLRKASKIENTFLRGHVLGHEHKGRIHADLNQLKSEREEGGGYGTVSGRYSSTSPNLQQLPARDPEWGPLIRSLFLPEEGELIASADYSSQEPRLAVHFAYLAGLRGAYEAVQRFRGDPRTDYHGMVAVMANIPRKDAKAINLGLAYGMGGAKLARSLGLPTIWKSISAKGEWKDIDASQVVDLRRHGVQCVELAGPEAKEIIEKWENGAPFLRGLYDLAETAAKTRGYIKTILGRRCRFSAGMARGNGLKEEFTHTHKALNKLCQGSAADQTKKGMLDLWNAGVVPLLTVHDELIFSVRDEDQARGYAEVMERAVPLEIPSIVDVHCGVTWGDVEK